jgi:FXSXX-COOH protein
MDEVPPDIETGLIDLTGLNDFAEIKMLDDSVLARSLRRVLRRTEHADEAVASFNSTI